METKANPLLVGSFALALIAALAVAVAWIARVQVDQESQLYHVFFSGSVTGLQEGSPVRYRGIQVGRVVDLRIAPENEQMVRATLEVEAETPIKTDSIAALEWQGITGAVYVQILGGSQQAPLLRAVAEGVPVIPSQPSAFAELTTAAPELLGTMTDIAERAQRVFSDENVARMSNILANVETASADIAAMTQSLRGAAERVDGLVADADALLSDVGAKADALSEEAAGALAELRGALRTAQDTLAAAQAQIENAGGGVAEAAQAIENLAGQISNVVEENRGALAEFATGGLARIGDLAQELQDLTSSLSRVTTQIERDAGAFFFGQNNGGVRVE